MGAEWREVGSTRLMGLLAGILGSTHPHLPSRATPSRGQHRRQKPRLRHGKPLQTTASRLHRSLLTSLFDPAGSSGRWSPGKRASSPPSRGT